VDASTGTSLRSRSRAKVTRRTGITRGEMARMSLRLSRLHLLPLTTHRSLSGTGRSTGKSCCRSADNC